MTIVDRESSYLPRVFDRVINRIEAY